MDGYDFMTAVDGKHWGTVVGREGDYVIVEHGTLRKHRYAVPEASVEIDDGARQVRTSLSGELISDSPKVDGGLDVGAVARHYGLVGTEAEPLTEGYGETVAEDPASGAESGEQRRGVETAVEARARIREGDADATDAMPDDSPALLGDRLADVREDEPTR
jgi:hypothetical protein